MDLETEIRIGRNYGLIYSDNPGYYELIVDSYRVVTHYYGKGDYWSEYKGITTGMVDEFSRYYSFDKSNFIPIFYISIIFTIIRYAFNKVIVNPIVDYLNLDQSNRSKFAESFWKCITFSMFWFYVADLLVISEKYDYFTKPFYIWDDWKIGMEVPNDITFIYFVECGFYLHSIYATIYMDEKRKDYVVSLIHHVLSVVLIIVSYGTRYHKFGLMVFFFHDVTDILLEFTKCNVYLKKRNGKNYAIHEYLSNFGFVAFTIAWVLFRLYWFPLKVMYFSAVRVVKAHEQGAGLYGFFNNLLYILLCLDLYWFFFIVKFLYKIATGQLKEVEDIRETDENEVKEKKKTN